MVNSQFSRTCAYVCVSRSEGSMQYSTVQYFAKEEEEWNMREDLIEKSCEFHSRTLESAWCHSLEMGKLEKFSADCVPSSSGEERKERICTLHYLHFKTNCFTRHHWCTYVRLLLLVTWRDVCFFSRSPSFLLFLIQQMYGLCDSYFSQDIYP